MGFYKTTNRRDYEMRYRMKSRIVDAIQYDGENINQIVSCFDSLMFSKTKDGELQIKEPMRFAIVRKGDYIVRKLNGDHFACSRSFFNQIYVEVCGCKTK